MTDPLAELFALGLCCPRCRGDLLAAHGGELQCAGCGERYPVILGIPDLRVFPDPYIGIEEDCAKGRLLAEWGAGRRWEEVAARYYEITRDTVPPAQAARFAAGLRAAVPRATAALESWESMSGDPITRGERVLDVGCGTAPLLVAVGLRGAVTVGVDIAFRWLVVGKLRLADAGVHAPLVCACAEALPFRDGGFDVYVTQGTMENVRDQAASVSESRRVLRDGGRMWISTANRTSLGPDPHLGLPAGGLLPSSVANAWARWRGALPPARRLLSRGRLTRLLKQGGFREASFAVPAISTTQSEGWGPVLRGAALAYEIARKTRAAAPLLAVVGPTIIASARK